MNGLLIQSSWELVFTSMAINRSPVVCVSILISILTGCSTASHDASTMPTTATTQTSPAPLVGTWKWDSVKIAATGKEMPIEEPFFMRFYEDGTMATWPTPSQQVSRGSYAVRNGKLVLLNLPSGEKELPIQVTLDQMSLSNEQGDRTVYHRVVPNVEPGRLPTTRAK